MRGSGVAERGRLVVFGRSHRQQEKVIRRQGEERMKTVLGMLLLLLAGLPAGVAQEKSAEQDAVCVGGTPASPVKIEVFSDYQCPACRDFYLGTMRTVLADYADAGKVCVVYREFPLNMHAHAREAARYAHAALRLGIRQWAQVTDALYGAQDQWAQDGKVDGIVAGALGKDEMARLRKLLADPSVNAAIARDVARGEKLEVNSTPTFFITANGKTEKATGVVQLPILRRYLDHLLGN